MLILDIEQRLRHLEPYTVLISLYCISEVLNSAIHQPARINSSELNSFCFFGGQFNLEAYWALDSKSFSYICINLILNCVYLWPLSNRHLKRAKIQNRAHQSKKGFHVTSTLFVWDLGWGEFPAAAVATSSLKKFEYNKCLGHTAYRLVDYC